MKSWGWKLFELSHYNKVWRERQLYSSCIFNGEDLQGNILKSVFILDYLTNISPGLKQQNHYLCVIIVCGYFSFIKSFAWLNFPSESNSYHKTSLSMSFGYWYLSGIPLFAVTFYSLYKRVTEEIWTAISIKHQFMHYKSFKGKIPATFITCILRNSHFI